MITEKLKRPVSGILRGPKREWRKHQAFIRRHTCIVTLSALITIGTEDECDGAIECCHYRTAANSGKSQKPFDWFCFPGCRKHHAEQHRIGQPAFERKFGLSLAEICAEFAKLSTDTAMQEAMKELGL